jgi:hypothetical protein
MAFLGIGAKKPKYDTSGLADINQRALNTQKDLIGQKSAGLAPLNAAYETKRNALSASLAPETEKLLGQYGQEMSGVDAQEAAAREAGSNKFREQAFREVPAVQQAIRNQLSGNRLMGSGAAMSSLAKPTIQAVQNASDQKAQSNLELMANQTQRAQGMADTNLGARKTAMAARIGMDEGTINELTAMGRTDLIDKFNALSGAEEQFSSNAIGIEQANQASKMAQDSPSGWGSVLGSVAGLGLGATTGNPMLAAVGSQVGGMAGGALSGENAPQLDPTMLYALMQRNAMKKSLGGASGPSAASVATTSKF